MKWKNIDAGPGYYFITGTFTEWLPLMTIDAVRSTVCDSITQSLADCGASLAAFVLMPDHLHLLTYLPEEGLLHKFCKLWRGRSGRKIAALVEKHADAKTLSVLARHANGGSRYAVWKEQVRALLIYQEAKYRTMMDYIHENPVRRGLTEHPSEWPWSSYRFYESGERPLIEVVPPESRG